MNFKIGDMLPRYTTMYFVSLALLVASLPLSKFTMSLFQFSTLFFWLWHGVNTSFLKKHTFGSSQNPVKIFFFIGELVRAVFLALIQKFIEFFKNKVAVVLASLLLLHVIGLIYTTDYEYALKDLRTKVPLFILPLFIATGPRITTKTFYWILLCFIAAVFGGSLYRLILFINLPVADSRALSAHTSHIRYSLNAVFAVFAALYFVSRSNFLSRWQKIFLLSFSIWIIAFIFFMNYSTGIILFLILGFLFLLYYAFKNRSFYHKAGLLTAVILLFVLPLLYFLSIRNNALSTPDVFFSKLDKYTVNGNTYYHDTVNFRAKHGKWAGLYICDKELRQSWTIRSKIPIDSLDNKRQIIRFTLISYLASKDLRKDSIGVFQLTDSEIREIENGINSANPSDSKGLRTQVEDFITGYKRYIQYKDPNSGSLIQRFEYWRTSLLIIKQHLIWGVGTGDIPSAFEKEYKNMNSNLAFQNRLRSHNQYLSITIAFGIIGLVWFMFILLYPGMVTKAFNNYFYLIFWIIFMLSMLTEDTIESQEGVTFYILFTALMLLGREKAEPEEQLFNNK